MSSMIALYHSTSREAAESILAHGFRDGIGYYMANRRWSRRWSGVWLSDVPLDGGGGGVLLRVHLKLPESDLVEYEWIEEGKPYREWLVPAAILNSVMRIEVTTHQAVREQELRS